MFLPLPTINPLNRVEAIRRILVSAPLGDQQRIADIRRRLASHDLTMDGEVVGVLNHLAESDWVVKQYTQKSHHWSTVTPVILPGHDDHQHKKTEELLRKAFRQAGYSTEVVEQLRLEWRRVGFRAGVELARRYEVPANLKKYPAWHVRVRFAHPVAGPLVIGAGRYRGFGLFVSESP